MDFLLHHANTTPPVIQALLGTIFTWFVTALGAGLVFLVPRNLTPTNEGKVLDVSLGFGGGVMLAASFWSLLQPCIIASEEAGWGNMAWIPATVGFVVGATFVWLSEVFIPDEDADLMTLATVAMAGATTTTTHNATSTRRRRVTTTTTTTNGNKKSSSPRPNKTTTTVPGGLTSISKRRIVLLMMAIVLHNLPEGLAVGVQFGVCSKGDLKCVSEAITLALGIGLQNFPEGLAVSLPLRRLGYSRRDAFFYGQLSGFVEPFGGLFGAGLVQIAKPILPYALAFAAGAMVFVVADSVVPESHERGNGRLASWGMVVGFVTMMSLDVGFG